METGVEAAQPEFKLFGYGRRCSRRTRSTDGGSRDVADQKWALLVLLKAKNSHPLNHQITLSGSSGKSEPPSASLALSLHRRPRPLVFPNLSSKRKLQDVGAAATRDPGSFGSRAGKLLQKFKKKRNYLPEYHSGAGAASSTSAWTLIPLPPTFARPLVHLYTVADRIKAAMASNSKTRVAHFPSNLNDSEIVTLIVDDDLLFASIFSPKLNKNGNGGGKVYISDLTELFTWTCERCNGLTKGFEIIELVVDIENCLQAFVGVAKDLNAIVIAFRGTQEHSIQNWIEDLFWKQLDLNYPGMPDAMVHHGFYTAYHNTTIRHGILHAVKEAREFYGDLDIIVTGHSMGGAMASFCALDLTVNHEAKNVQVMTFGQPRIGNAAFASSYAQLVPNTIRVTNDHDIVPHLPPYYTFFPQKTYHHFPREVWLYNLVLGSLVYRVEKLCDGSGEDPTCSRSVTGNSIIDHLSYYGVDLMCQDWTSCRIVMDPRVTEYGKTDLKGNFILSRAPTTGVLKTNTRSNEREVKASA
ncbi:hypothetical protein V6N13_047597 [Hibiscus sabdariffa]